MFTFYHVMAGAVLFSLCYPHKQGEMSVPDKTGVAPMTRWNTGTNCPAELPAGDIHQPAARNGGGLPCRDTDLRAGRGGVM